MFDIGWSELLVIGALALIVVGPKDLPAMLRNLGRYAGKMRSMAREFQRSMEDAAREADLGELRDVQKSIGGLNRKVDLDSLTKPAKKAADAAAKPKPAAAATPASNPASGPASGSLDAADAAETAAHEAAQARAAEIAKDAAAMEAPPEAEDKQAKGA